MSRSNPNENSNPNPATRWFEWNGEAGSVRYYDKDAKKNIDVGADFTFMLLDQLGCVRGWHEPSESGIYSNEVKDTRQDVLIVKAFKLKGASLAEGLYKDIKDRVNTLGGQFVANCYIAFTTESGSLALGSLRFKGASLGAWMEFTKAHRSELFDKAVQIDGFTEGKKGRITYRMPKFALAVVSDEENRVAAKLDAALQSYLKGYLAKNTQDRAEAPHLRDEDVNTDLDLAAPLTDSDIPF